MTESARQRHTTKRDIDETSYENTPLVETSQFIHGVQNFNVQCLSHQLISLPRCYSLESRLSTNTFCQYHHIQHNIQNSKTLVHDVTTVIYTQDIWKNFPTQVTFILWQNPALIGNLPPRFSDPLCI